MAVSAPTPALLRNLPTSSEAFESNPTTIDDNSHLYSYEGEPNAVEKHVKSDIRVSTKEKSTKNVPYHVYGERETMVLVVIVSAAASLSGLSSNVYFPAMVDVAKDLHISYSTVNLSITSYLIAQGIAPSFWGPLADHFGRRTILIATLTLYLISNIALGLVQNAPMLLVFRAIQAAGSSSTISLGAGVITDIASPEQRGGYQGTFSGVRQFSIALGPVIGGVLAGTLGYRSIFWLLVILSASVIGLIVLILPETLRRISGNGCNPSSSVRFGPLLARVLPYCSKEKLLSKFSTTERDDIEDACENLYHAREPFTCKIFAEPMKMLLEKDVACALTFGACSYTAWSMMTSQTTAFLTDIYGFSTIMVGLAFLANGLGCVCGSYLSGKGLNKTYRRESSLWKHFNGLAEDEPLPRPAPPSFPIEKARLSEAPFYSAIQMLGLLIFGWCLTSSQPNVPNAGVAHWIAPLFAQFAVGYANTAVLNSNSTFIADLYPGRSASASAVLNLTRNLMAAVGVSVADYLSAALSPGWYGTVLAAIVLVGLVPNVLHSAFGPRWRERRHSSMVENVK